MQQLLEKNSLEFHSLGRFSSHAYLRREHPLAGEKVLTAEQLLPYPCVRYEQGGDSFHFSEEVVVLEDAMRYIYVTDRSTMLSVIRNADAYNIGSGCLLPNVVDPEIIMVPLQNYMDCMQIGWIKLKSTVLQLEVEEYVHLMQESLRKMDRYVGRRQNVPKRG